VRAALVGLMALGQEVERPLHGLGVFFRRPVAQPLEALPVLKPRLEIEKGEEEPWELKDLRKTCATYYDEHVPESSVETLGHSVGGITYRRYAHRAPPAFRAIMTLP
jgi:hypothetical protein